MSRSVRWPDVRFEPPATAAPSAAGDVVPPHAGSGPLTSAQYHRARVRMALEQLVMLVEDLEACPPPVRQAACTALEALVELQAVLQAEAR